VQEVEDVHGSRFDDVILGDAGPTHLVDHGHPGGDDVIVGRGGNDAILGDFGADQLDGGYGLGSLDGEPGTDDCTNGEAVTNCE
jgi:hypothetical protein